jgi:hypothetical protein
MTERFICPQCGPFPSAIQRCRGNDVIEVYAWIAPLFLMLLGTSLSPLAFFPAAVYSAWRLFHPYDACPQCDDPSIAETSTPLGRAMLDKYRALSVHRASRV